MALDAPHSPVTVEQDDLIALKARTRHTALPQTHKPAMARIGETRSPFRTRGLDFQEMRAYQPGDDIRQINWRMTAKYGKPFTKLYTEEKERPVYLLCDMRSRMKFASHGDFKSVVAARMTVFLAWLAERKKDTIHSVLLLPKLIKTRTPESGEQGVFHLIQDVTAASVPTQTEPDETTLEQGIAALGRQAASGALIFICSDCHDLSAKAVRELVRLGQKGTVALVRIYDRMEADLPAGVFPITDGVGRLTVDTTNRQVRQAFKASFEQTEKAIQDAVKRYGWGYLSVQTTDDYIGLLAAFSRGGGK